MKMILKVFFIQRKCIYDGEYSPEAMVCVDEFCYGENPRWFDDQVKNYLKEQEGNLSSHGIIDIEIDQEKISSILNDTPTVQGEIK